MEPRTPTEEEKDELVPYGIQTYHKTASPAAFEEQRSFVDTAAIAVFDHSITHGPGYGGKLMVVVWSGSPSFYSVFVWRKEGIEEVAREA